MTVHSIPAIHVLYLADVAERFGVKRDELLDGRDPEALSEPNARLSIPELIELIERARELTGEPGIGFHVGLQMRIASHGYLGLAAMTASNVHEAMRIAIKFAPTRTRAISLSLDHDGDHVRFAIHEHADLGTARDAFLFALLTGIWRIGNALTGIALEDHGTADVAFPEPDYFARFAPLAPHVRFDRDVTCLRFRASLLDRPLVTGDPSASRLTLERCERELEALAPRVASRVQAILAGGFLPLEDIARQLGMSARTLKRRLAEEDTTYRAIVEAARKARAEELLRSARSLEAIASELGYADVAAFSRAFRRWTGRAPGAWRRSA
jgi:AraC-like DNA-binding protein